jgi:quercetin dioxygenase-like cupin family protein
MGDGTTGALLPENVVENKLQGERFVFAPPTREVSAFQFFLAPGGGMPMLHCHAKQAEIFRCRAGTMTILRTGGREQTLRPGDELHIAPGEFHGFVNRGQEEVRCDVEYRPAGKSEDWLRIGTAVVVLENRAPTLLEIAPFVLDVDMFVPGPPIALQRVLFKLLRAVAIALGHKRKMLARAERVYARPFTW